MVAKKQVLRYVYTVTLKQRKGEIPPATVTVVAERVIVNGRGDLILANANSPHSNTCYDPCGFAVAAFHAGSWVNAMRGEVVEEGGTK